MIVVVADQCPIIGLCVVAAVMVDAHCIATWLDDGIDSYHSECHWCYSHQHCDTHHAD